MTRQPLFEFDPPPVPLTPPAGFADEAAAMGIEFEPGEIERLGHFLALLLAANQRVNLTAITEPLDGWRKHVLDALTLMPMIMAVEPDPHRAEPDAQAWGDPAPARHIIDVGAGGGVPGIPLAIVMPRERFTLVDATGKKCDFQRFAARTLGLNNVRVIHERAEVIGQNPEHRERYDLALARALGPLSVVAELTAPLVRVGGAVLAVKGAKADEELERARPALMLLNAVHEQTVSTPTGRIVVLGKRTRTPRGYPRRPGEPKARPLGEAPARP